MEANIGTQIAEAIDSHQSNTFTSDWSLNGVWIKGLLLLGLLPRRANRYVWKWCLLNIDSGSDIVCCRADQLYSKSDPDDTTCQLNPSPSPDSALWIRGWPSCRPYDHRQALWWPNCAGCRLYLWRHQGWTWKLNELHEDMGSLVDECVVMTNRLSYITNSDI